MKRNKKLALIIIIFVLLVVLFILFQNISSITSLIKSGENENKRLDSGTAISISTKENDKVLVVLESANGIKEVRCPNGMVIQGGGKYKIAMDYIVEANQKYTFRITDMENIGYNQSFISPQSHIEITKNDIDVDLEVFSQLLDDKLNDNLIATNFVHIGAGDQNYVDSESTEMQEVFNKWSSFGDGNWYYDGNSKTVYNTKNSDHFTGYYFPGGDYDDIDLSFNARTTDADDDMMGAMIRFNRPSSNNFSSYLFLFDRHDNGGGVLDGAFNGLNKIQNKNLAASGYVSGWNLASYLTKLKIDKNIRWTRNTWQNYRFVAKGTKLEAYIDNRLVAEATDTSITTGTYGFLALSQAYTYYKDILIKTNKAYTLPEVLELRTWNLDDVNILINLNNSAEPLLLDSACINTFKTNDIHYIAVGTETIKPDVETFLQYIDNKGTWQDSSDYDTYVEGIITYLNSALQF